jgi:hypothetical protein
MGTHRVHGDRPAVGEREPRRAVEQLAAEPIEIEELVAQVVAAGAARRAGAARHHERGDDIGPDRRAGDAWTERHDAARDLVPHHGGRRERDFGLHHVQVGVADPARVNLDQYLTGVGLRNRNPLDPQPSRGGVENGGGHQLHACAR